MQPQVGQLRQLLELLQELGACSIAARETLIEAEVQ
jgi:hypothetical protein